MRFGLWILAALFIGAFAAHFLLADRGYVLINFRGYVIETSVPALVLIVLAGLLLARALLALWRAPRRLGAALSERSQRRAGGRLTRGLIHLTEGDWARAERLLTRGLKGNEAPLVNYLIAARAAQLQGSRERRDEWLKIAFEESPGAEVAVLLTQAELQFDSGELERALATLQRIEQTRPDHPVALALLARACHALGERQRLVDLLPRLGRARLDDETRERFAGEALEHAFERADLTRDKLDGLWAALSPALRRSPVLIGHRARALQRLGRGEEGERELRAALKRNWHPALLHAYGDVRGNEPLKQLRQAESWLKTYPEDGALLMTAARLCIGNELWGKARSYLESSLAIAPEPNAYALYGRLLTQLGEEERAAVAYSSGLSLVTGPPTDVPALTGPESPDAEIARSFTQDRATAAKG
jgi:HemY protein